MAVSSGGAGFLVRDKAYRRRFRRATGRIGLTEHAR
jgi:hypothetical protein